VRAGRVEPDHCTELAPWSRTEAYPSQWWPKQFPLLPSSMRRLGASSGSRHLCAEGAKSCCCVILTKSITRVELEQKTYDDSTIVHEPALIVQKGLRVFRRCLKGRLLYLIASSCGIVPSRNFWVVLEMVRNIPERLRSETKINRRTEHSNRRTGKIERSIASRGNVRFKRREWRDLNSMSRNQSLSSR